jgi:hypothetical protein
MTGRAPRVALALLTGRLLIDREGVIVSDVKLGALCWNQDADWPNPLEAGAARTGSANDTLWTWGQRLLSRSASPSRSRGSCIGAPRS